MTEAFVEIHNIQKINNKAGKIEYLNFCDLALLIKFETCNLPNSVCNL